MDSCHFLNFFFGQKKAVSEISKCFNSLTNLKSGKKFKSRDTTSGKYTVKDTDDYSENKPSTSNHLSPIKQLKSKFFSSIQTDQQSNNPTPANTPTKQNFVRNNNSQRETDNPDSIIVTGSINKRDGKLFDGIAESQKDRDNTRNNKNISTISVIDNGGQSEVVHSTIVVSSELQSSRKANASVVYVNPPVSSIVVISPSKSIIEADGDNNEDISESTLSAQVTEKSALNSIHPNNLQKSAKNVRKKPQQQVIYDDGLSESLEKPIATAVVCDIISGNRKLYAERKFSSQIIDSQLGKSFHSTRNETLELDKNTSNKCIDTYSLDGQCSGEAKVRSSCESLRRSSEGSTKLGHKSAQDISSQCMQHHANTSSKPTTIVKPLPPKTPPKSSKARYLNYQLSLSSPTKVQDLFREEKFIKRFFKYFDSIDYCILAQVCKIWRKTLYSDHKYWTGLINVIDCNQLRRECLVERNTPIFKQDSDVARFSNFQLVDENNNTSDNSTNKNGQSHLSEWPAPPSPLPTPQQITTAPMSLEKVSQSNLATVNELEEIKKHVNFDCIDEIIHKSDANNDSHFTNEQTYPPSKSCSIQSHISTSLVSSSPSGLSLASPTSESSKFDTVKAKLYSSIDRRGFDAICLFGANDEDVIDLVNRLPSRVLSRIKVGRLSNSSISNKGLESFLTAMLQINELELSGCNELTNNINLTTLTRLTKLIITDCINIADGFAPKLSHIFGQLSGFTLQAYHITDAFFEYLQSNVNGDKLTVLELPNCKEISNQSLVVIAKFFPNLQVLSLSGSTKISDEGIEILADQSRCLNKLDISWCTRVTDAALECMACDLSESLTDLVLDRCIHITDVGLGYIATMARLRSLEIRWCQQISDQGLETIITMRSLRCLSIAGCHQITMRSLLCLVRSQLIELELTNCPSVSSDLVSYLRKNLPNCTIIF